MLINHKNFHLTQIPDKNNDAIFLKSQKTLFWGIFDHFWSFFAPRCISSKNPALLHTTIHGPLTVC